jgi:formate dehydrogenase
MNKKTFCRVCEPSCGLVASIENEEIQSLKPDKDHPVTQGFACHKGLAVLDIHKDPDRLKWPLAKVDGSFSRVCWSDATQAVGNQIRALQALHGDQSIAVYTGNPLAFNSTAGPAGEIWLRHPGLRQQIRGL